AVGRAPPARGAGEDPRRGGEARGQEDRPDPERALAPYRAPEPARGTLARRVQPPPWTPSRDGRAERVELGDPARTRATRCDPAPDVGGHRRRRGRVREPL